MPIQLLDEIQRKQTDKQRIRRLEQMVVSLTSILVERGVVTLDEVDASLLLTKDILPDN